MATRTARCKRCNAQIEYIGGKDPYWRHVKIPFGMPHGAVPKR